ncbi:MAG TPA: discoidin domain-containing protein [Gemmatimonadaceae bacterium]
MLALASVALAASPLPAQPRVLDSFESLDAWREVTSDNVALELASAPGVRGRGMAMRFDFRGGGGYAIARRELPLDLPENYEFTFWVRGETAPQTLEFKLVDPSGENVWWVNRRDFEFPERWTRVTFKRRHITFAWGPRGGGAMERMAALELTVTASSGGSGTVYVDELAFEPLEPVRPYDRTPEVTATSGATGSEPANALDGDPVSAWRSVGPPARQALSVDFLRTRELGGLHLTWGQREHAVDYAVLLSRDGARWDTARVVRGSNGGDDWLYLPETEARHLRLAILRPATARGVTLRELDVLPLEAASSLTEFVMRSAAGAPPGALPRGFAREQAYWTVVGAHGDGAEALIDTDGSVEVGAGAFSLTPFVRVGDRLLSWAHVEREPSLAEGSLPIPTVAWRRDSLRLLVTAFADGEPGEATLWTRYRVENAGADTLRATLHVVLRPFQVNPPWQFLAVEGGVAPIARIAWDGRVVRVDEGRRRGADSAARVVAPVTRGASFGASTFDAGGVVAVLHAGRIPDAASAADPLALASGVLSWPLAIAPGGRGDVWLAVPMHASSPAPPAALDADSASRLAEARLADAAGAWRSRLGHVRIDLPDTAGARRIVESLRANVGWILVNRDGPAIQPGSRSYARSWIRDGALTSTGLLRMGRTEEVREFIEWFAPFQFPNGKVPCCVDRRGADPVPEHDSHGELVYLIAEYWRYTGDSALVARMWPHVAGAVGYIDSLRRQRLGPEWETPENRRFHGILPPSISHEGYSAKPMHSYWDDFFALRGLEDGVAIARLLGRDAEARAWSAIRDEFRRAFFASIRLTMDAHDLDWIAGAADIGDFDATSTTIGIAPGGQLAALDSAGLAFALRRTFGRYWEEFVARRDGAREWDAYTPYELRTVGTFVRLGERAKAHELLDFFFDDQRPNAWRHWAEVVWRDSSAARFIGDMPHGWVGSDFIRSALDLFAYDREADSALVVGAGIVEPWVTTAPGVHVDSLPTIYGSLSYTMRAEMGVVRVRLAPTGLRIPPGGIAVLTPFDRPVTRATVNGAPVDVRGGREVIARSLPAEVVFDH